MDFDRRFMLKAKVNLQFHQKKKKKFTRTVMGKIIELFQSFVGIDATNKKYNYPAKKISNLQEL